jgi:hypothetical protein
MIDAAKFADGRCRRSLRPDVRLGSLARTLGDVRAMSALPPKADIQLRRNDGRYGPEADMVAERFSAEIAPGSRR